MARTINTAAQAALVRLSAIRYDAPQWHEREVIRCFERQYGLLGLSMPEVAVAEDLATGYQLAWGTLPTVVDCPSWGRTQSDPWASVLWAAWRAAEAADREAIRSAVWDVAWMEVREATRDTQWGAAWYAHALTTDAAVAKKGRWEQLWVQVAAEQLLALEHGLGWFFLTHRKLILVPLPRMLMLSERLHYDHGKAVEWPNGTGYYFLRGVPFNQTLYEQITQFDIEAEEVLQIPNADRRAVALSMLRPDRLLAQLHAELIHTGIKGTKLYRVRNFMGTRRTEYCMVMDDTSSDRQFLEWVKPGVGRQGNADLCQARAFGIPLADYLTMDQES